MQRDGQDLSKLEHLSKDVFGAKAKTEFSSTGDQVSEDLESNVENELMTGGFAKGVTLTDQLSGNVKPVSTDTKGRPGLSVGVSTDGGKATTLVEGKDYEYTYANNRISVRLLNQLKGSQTVTVTIPVKPTDKVLQQAVAGQPGPDTGDPGTGSLSAGKHGWYSNTGTNTVTHTSPNTGATGTSTLPKPVIPVQVARLQYDKNAETATGDMGKDAVTAPAGSEQAIAANKFANANYTFQGWNTQADGKGKTYQKGDKLTLPAGTTVLYSQWKRIPGTLTWVKTDKDSGEVLAGSEWTLTPKDGQPTAITDNGELDQAGEDGAFKLTGLDWGEYELMETKAPEGHDPISAPITVTIDAKHTTVNIGDVSNAKTPAKVTYDPNGGEGQTPGYDGHVGDTPEASENKFTNKDECKEFAGWNTQKDGKGKTYQKGDQLDPLTGTAILYAQWKTKDGCPAAPAALQELGKTGAGITPIAIGMAAATLLGACLMILRRQRHARHA